MNIDNFIHRKSYEKVERVVRRHPITFFKTIFFFLVLLVVPFVVFLLINSLFPTLLEGPILFPLSILLLCIYILSVTVFFYSFFVDFYLDEMIITNDRLVDVEQNGLLARTIAETDLYLIQDVTSEVKGFFGSLFRYGKVSIQTAGAVPKFVAVDVPDPDELRQLLLNLASEDKKFHNK